MTLMTEILFATLALSVLPFPGAPGDSTTLRMGTDLTHYANETSMYSVGFQHFEANGLGYKLDAGGWTESASDRKSAPFGSVLVGKRFGSVNGINMTNLIGVAVIGIPDSALSTTFQFTEEAAVGYKAVGLGYKHFSNAGIKEPNHGRDYIYLNFAFPF